MTYSFISDTDDDEDEIVIRHLSQPAVEQHSSNVGPPQLADTPSLNALLDVSTPSNELYKHFVHRHMPVVQARDDGKKERMLVLAGTGEGKARIGMHVGLESYLANIDIERTLHRIPKEQRGNVVRDYHLTLICVPYIVIAEQFFTKLACIRITRRRPVLVKMLTSTNKAGNTHSIFWKKDAQQRVLDGIMLSNMLETGHKDDSRWEHMTQEERESALLDVWDREYWNTPRMPCDVIVGMYEECVGLLRKVPEGTTLYFVFDELQEALIASSSRFSTAFSLAFKLCEKATGSGILLSGCTELLTLRNNKLFKPLLGTLNVLTHHSLPKLLSTKPFHTLQTVRGRPETMTDAFKRLFLTCIKDSSMPANMNADTLRESGYQLVGEWWVPTMLRVLQTPGAVSQEASINESKRITAVGMGAFLVCAHNMCRDENVKQTYIVMMNMKSKTSEYVRPLGSVRLAAQCHLAHTPYSRRCSTA